MRNRKKLDRIIDLADMTNAEIWMLNQARDSGNEMDPNQLGFLCSSMFEKLDELVRLAESIPLNCILDGPEDDAGETE